MESLTTNVQHVAEGQWPDDVWLESRGAFREKTQKTHSSSEMLEYSRKETEEWGPDGLLELGWTVISAAVRLSGDDVWGTISSTAQHL